MTVPSKKVVLERYREFILALKAEIKRKANVYTNTQKGGAGEPSLIRKVILLPVQGTITSPYGPRIIDGKPEFHEGVDIAAPMGTPILSMSEGTVIYAKNFGKIDEGLGNGVKVRREDGIEVLYGHCHSMLVSKGNPVTRSQVVATVGHTGRCKSKRGGTGDHLHLQVQDRKQIVKQRGTRKPLIIPPEQWFELGLWVDIGGGIEDIVSSVTLPGLSPMLQTARSELVNKALASVRGIQMSKVNRAEITRAAEVQAQKRIASSSAELANDMGRDEQLPKEPPKRVADVTNFLYETNEF